MDRVLAALRRRVATQPFLQQENVLCRAHRCTARAVPLATSIGWTSVKRLSWSAAPTSAVLGLALALAGCSGGTKSAASIAHTPSSSRGAKVFADAGCGGCHTLAAAG